MRLARLDLTRYGRFSDRTIDFGEKLEGGSDFHIVYGLNEAGKSTTAAAILDLLFGIEKTSPYGASDGRNGWHAYNAMRIGGLLELSGGRREVARLKRDKNSLVDAENRPLDEALVKAELGGIDRAAFRTMFSLDDESLEKGGEAILASRGDLGQLLFSASAGLAELGGRLGALREEAERFFRPRASKTDLAEKRRQLEALKAERERVDTLASAYVALARARDAAQAAYDASTSALAERRARAEIVRGLLSGLPRLAVLREAEANLALLADLPPTPAGWDAEAKRLADEAIRLETQRDEAAAAIAAHEAALARIGEDGGALSVGPRVDAWREARGRYVTAKDIPVREGERDAKRATVAEILRRLDREDEAEPRRLLLSDSKVGVFNDLIASRSGVIAKLQSERAAHGESKIALEAALAEAPEGGADSAAIEALKRELQKARRDESAARLRAMREERERLGRQILAAIAGLAPWQGSPEALALVAVPGPAETEALRQRRAQASAVRDGHRRRLSEKTGEAERLKAEDAAAKRAEIISDESADGIRAARESAWSLHRAALDGASAGAFEAAMRRDDAAGAERLAYAHEVAAARERAVKLAGLAAERIRTQAELETAEAEFSDLDAGIAALSPVETPAGRDRLACLDAWRARRDDALALVARLGEMKEDARRINDKAERTHGALGDALRAAAVPFDSGRGVEALIEAGEAAIVAEARVAGLCRTVKERHVDLARAERRLKAAVEDDERWCAEWRQACAGGWLGEGNAEPPLAAVRQALAALADLRPALGDCASLDHRIEAMYSDRRAFAGEVADIARTLGLNGNGDPLAVADAIEARLGAARDDFRRREEAVAALAKSRAALAEVAQKLTLNARLAATMTERFAVATLREVSEALEACRRRDSLKAEVEKETHAILQLGIAGDSGASRVALESADRVALQEDLAALSAREAGDRADNNERYAALAEAGRRLDAVGGDDAAARIEEKRRTIIEEIKDGARRYLTLRAGVAAAEAALALYRERHRGAMMEHAARAFCEISRGAYRGLAAEPNGDSETLIALSRDGGSKTADQLSKGARFQLYLALRVAGYHELAKARTPAPFVADDIMETFDHFRAEEALRLFAEMGKAGQVIYLTHHLHLVEIARRVCPEARVHELAA